MKYFESHYINTTKEHACDEREICSLIDIQREIAATEEFTLNVISRIRAIDYSFLEEMRSVSKKLETLNINETIVSVQTDRNTLTYKRIAVN